jgi:pyruvate dehydrogenase E2 component (dihydrolipoamide acetyltransferase)
MEEGTVLRWMKSDGDEVVAGDELVELETDKATVTYDSPSSGFLQIVIREGQTVGIGQPIATLEAELTASSAPTAHRTGDSQPTAGRPGKEQLAAGQTGKASTLARRMARSLELDLSTISGSGPGGRIVKTDVEAAAARAGAASPPAPGANAGGEERNGRGGVQNHELTSTQRLIARRMVESRATVPDFSVEADIDMDAGAAHDGDRRGGGEPVDQRLPDQRLCARAPRELQA